MAQTSATEHTSTTDHASSWIVDRFDDIKVLRYEVPGFEQLSLTQKKLVYYLAEAAKCGRDILFDQNCAVNLALRRLLEHIYTHYTGNRAEREWLALEKYLKKMWFANGIHHHYSNDKFQPEFSEAYLRKVVASLGDEQLPADFEALCRVLFDPTIYPSRLNQSASVDMLCASASNYYAHVTQAEAEQFYAAKVAHDPNKQAPLSHGLNSQLTKDAATGALYERTWRVGGMYSPAIERIVYWLRRALTLTTGTQHETLAALIGYYETGDLALFNKYNILWLQDTSSHIDFINGFIETYGDPLGIKASWEANVNFVDTEACRRTQTIARHAQWFEEHSPIDPAFKKRQVRGVSAKVITVAMLGGDCYPATPIGINLPNADWIRKEYGSKSVTIDNITYAYDQAGRDSGFNEEFILRAEDRALVERYGKLADDLHTDLHECLGHGSGQLAPGVTGNELRSYGATLEEARADLFGLYYIGDPKMVELGLIPTTDVAKAQYTSYILKGLMTQLARIAPGRNIEEAHMRNRQLIAAWCYEQGRAERVIDIEQHHGKHYVVVNDFQQLRTLFGKLLHEIQRIKSEGDYEAGQQLVERYGVRIDKALHEEVLARYAALRIEPYSGFVNPEYTPVVAHGEVVDIRISYPRDYVQQMLNYSEHYSFLPNRN